MLLSGEIWKVKLYPVRDSEQDGVRPCLIVSPDSMNNSLSTVIILPMTTSTKPWPTRVDIELNGKQGQVCIEHIRSLSKSRFQKKLGEATDEEMAIIQKALQSTFAQ